MRRVAITGHTSGIGKALAEKFSALGFEVLGFSRSTGHDLSLPETIAEIVKQSGDCSYFINNAYCDGAQIELLYALFEKWRSSKKCIINISSTASDGIKNYPHIYAARKAALDKAAEQLNHATDSECRVINLRPGWVNTPRAAQLNVAGDPMLATEDLARVVEWIVALPPNVHIPLLNITAKK